MSKATKVWQSIQDRAATRERLLSLARPVVVEPIKVKDVAEKPVVQRKGFEVEDVRNQ